MPTGTLVFHLMFSPVSRAHSCVYAGGKKGGHKGKTKCYTSVEEVEEQEKKREREQQWRVSVCVYMYMSPEQGTASP